MFFFIYRIPKDVVIPPTIKPSVFPWCPPPLHPCPHPRTPPPHHPVTPLPATPPCHQLPAAVDGRRPRPVPAAFIRRQPAASSNKWHRRLARRHKCRWRPALTVPCPPTAGLAPTGSRCTFPGLPTASQITSTTTMLTAWNGRCSRYTNPATRQRSRKTLKLTACR